MDPFHKVAGRQAAHRKAAFAVLAILASPLVAGCMPSSPETVFDWNVNDRAPRVAYHPSSAHQPKVSTASGARTYVYREPLAPVPTPRPNPVVRQASLAPVPRPAVAATPGGTVRLPSGPLAATFRGLAKIMPRLRRAYRAGGPPQARGGVGLASKQAECAEPGRPSALRGQE